MVKFPAKGDIWIKELFADFIFLTSHYHTFPKLPRTKFPGIYVGQLPYTLIGENMLLAGFSSPVELAIALGELQFVPFQRPAVFVTRSKPIWLIYVVCKIQKLC